MKVVLYLYLVYYYNNKINNNNVHATINIKHNYNTIIISILLERKIRYR